jgi:hypothetical protein
LKSQKEEKRISERRDLRSQISDLRKRAQIWNLRRREENLRFEISDLRKKRISYLRFEISERREAQI